MTVSSSDRSKWSKFLSSRREEVIESQFNEIKRLESKYSKLYDEAPDMYRTINTDGIILECNQSYVRDLGYSTKDEVIGHSIFEYTADHDLQAMQESFDEWKRTGVVRNKEVWFKRKDGSVFPVLISANNLYDDDGQLIGSNSAIINETEMYKAKKQLESAKQMRDEFIKIAAHELRTPIQPILGYVELARKNIVDKDKAFDEIYDQALRLGRLATDLLDVTNIETGSLQYQMQKVDCNELVERAASSAQVRLDNASSQANILTELDSTADLNIAADPQRIMQVLSNLLNNAIKFTDKGTIKISTRLDESASRVYVEVRDSGKGISEDIIPRLFEKFATSSSADGNTEGTGLGLHLAAKIVEAHRGKIWGKNNDDGKGASFGFTLPVWRDDAVGGPNSLIVVGTDRTSVGNSL